MTLTLNQKINRREKKRLFNIEKWLQIADGGPFFAFNLETLFCLPGFKLLLLAIATYVDLENQHQRHPLPTLFGVIILFCRFLKFDKIQ
jgi:hypothetical protein